MWLIVDQANSKPESLGNFFGNCFPRLILHHFHFDSLLKYILILKSN